MLRSSARRQQPAWANAYGARHRNDGKRMKLFALFAFPALVLGGGGYVLNEYANVESISDDYCYERIDQHQSVFLIDSSFTHDMSDAQFRDLLTAHQRAYRALPANGRISIYTTAAHVNGSIPSPVFSACRPAATPAEQDAIGAPSKPAPYLRNQAADAEAEFLAAVDAVLADARDPDTAAADSPVLEQLYAISIDPGFQGLDRSLTVVTDGIQNSEIARFCSVRGDMPSFSAFETRPAYQDVRPDSFAGTQVSILLVEFGELPAPGLEHCTNQELRNWWRDYAEANGAEHLRLTPLRYWAQR